MLRDGGEQQVYGAIAIQTMRIVHEEAKALTGKCEMFRGLADVNIARLELPALGSDDHGKAAPL